MAAVLALLLSAAVPAATDRWADSVRAFTVEWDGQGCIEDYPVRAEITWDLGPGSPDAVEIRVDSADGALFSSGRRSGRSVTSDWVTQRTVFYLVAPSTGQVLASSPLMTPSCRAQNRGRLIAEVEAILEEKGDQAVRFESVPPRLIYCGQPVDRTSIKLRWDVSALNVNEVEIYLESADGRIFARGRDKGEAETRDWVSDGMKFVLYLPEVERVAAVHEFRILPCGAAAQAAR